MSKELEAFQSLRFIVMLGLESQHEYEEMNNKCEIIETALKEHKLMKNTKIVIVDKKISDDDLEKLKCDKIIADVGQCEIKPLFDEETLKKLKALEIIKEKQVVMPLFYFSLNKDMYNKEIKTEYELSQEEFDLLKEVLK